MPAFSGAPAYGQRNPGPLASKQVHFPVKVQSEFTGGPKDLSIVVDTFARFRMYSRISSGLGYLEPSLPQQLEVFAFGLAVGNEEVGGL